MNDTTLYEALSLYFDNPEVVSQEAMTHGRENTSFKLVLKEGKQLVLRIWGEEHSHMGRRKLSDITAELSFMMRCHEAGLAVPKVYTTRYGEPYAQLAHGYYFMVMNFVPGTSPQDLTTTMVQQLAETMAKMHILAQDFSFPEPRSWPGTPVEMTDNSIALYAQDTNLETSVREHLLAIQKLYRSQLTQLDLTALPSGPIHGDIFWENLKFEGEKLAGIFDFDDCRTSYFLEDILKTLWYDFEDPVHGFYGSDGAHVRHFMQAYQSVRPLSYDERSALPAIFSLSYAYRLASYVRRMLRGGAAMEEYRVRIPKLIAAYEYRKDTFLDQIQGQAQS